jgi:hypothetical protein
MSWQDPPDADDDYPSHLEGPEVQAARAYLDAEARGKLRDEAALRESAWRMSDAGHTYRLTKVLWEAVQQELRKGETMRRYIALVGVLLLAGGCFLEDVLIDDATTRTDTVVVREPGDSIVKYCVLKDHHWKCWTEP